MKVFKLKQWRGVDDFENPFSEKLVETRYFTDEERAYKSFLDAIPGFLKSAKLAKEKDILAALAVRGFGDYDVDIEYEEGESFLYSIRYSPDRLKITHCDCWASLALETIQTE